jgi:hypothetical protein
LAAIQSWFKLTLVRFGLGGASRKARSAPSRVKLRCFSLEKEVIATLVASTAVAPIGLVWFIARGLFKAPEK